MIQRLILLLMTLVSLAACGSSPQAANTELPLPPSDGRPTLFFFFTDN